MAEKLRRLTYDIHWAVAEPVAGKYIVSIGKKGIGTVYHIAEVRHVKSSVFENRYVLGVLHANELKEVTEYDPETQQVWVRGEEGYALFWYPRTKKRS